MKTGKSLSIFALLFLSIAVIFLACCGGGGGDGGVGVYYCTSQKDYLDSSYELHKTCLHITRQGIRQTNPGTFVHAIAYADFDNDGDEDVFISSGDGTHNTTPVEMYLSDGVGNFTLDLTIFDGEIPEAVHPRKALIGDFNGDNLPDIFVIGHGYDGPPWPGEPPLLILSSPSGLQNISGFEGYVGFHHGGASADIDADGDLDIFVADDFQPFFLINDGSGNFTYNILKVPDNDWIDHPLFTTFTAELIDVDTDGYIDLLVEGPEQGGMDTTIHWGSSTYTYTSSNKTVLPSVIGKSEVLDIDADDIDNDGDKDIVVTRTSYNYDGYYIQIIVNEGSRQFSDKTSERIVNGSNDRAEWIDWIRLQDINNDGYLDIIVDDALRRLIWTNNGTGVFQ